MRIERLELWRLELDLIRPLRTSNADNERRPLLLVRLVLDGQAGTGECEALSSPTYTEEFADSAELVLREQLLPRLLGDRDPDSLEEALGRLDAIRGHAMAKAALEMALLDATLRAQGEGLAAHLGAASASIPAGATVSLGPPDAVLADVAEAVEAGYRRVKVKIAPGADFEQLSEVRSAFPELALSADANGSYDLDVDEARAALARLDSLGLLYLEQPTPPRDHLASAAACRMLDTPVILDESVVTRNDLEAAVALSALDGVSVKPARLGGLLQARQVHDRCVELGLSLCIGGMLESGIGRAGAIALGAMPGFDLPGDLGASDRYFSPDLSEAHLLEEGSLRVPSGPGLGVQLDEDAIVMRTTRVLVVR